MSQALNAIEDLRSSVDTLIIIPNDRLLDGEPLCLTVTYLPQHFSCAADG